MRAPRRPPRRSRSRPARPGPAGPPRPCAPGSLGAHPLERRLGPAGVAAGHQDAGALAGQRDRGVQAEPGVGAGHEGRAAGLVGDVGGGPGHAPQPATGRLGASLDSGPMATWDHARHRAAHEGPRGGGPRAGRRRGRPVLAVLAGPLRGARPHGVLGGVARPGLAALPAVGERDVCPDGDPAGAAGLVLQAGESGYALHAEGPVLRRALLRRLAAPGLLPRPGRGRHPSDVVRLRRARPALPGREHPQRPRRGRPRRRAAVAGARPHPGRRRRQRAAAREQRAGAGRCSSAALGAGAPLLAPGDDAGRRGRGAAPRRAHRARGARRAAARTSCRTSTTPARRWPA